MSKIEFNIFFRSLKYPAIIVVADVFYSDLDLKEKARDHS